jgi:hypothetical protein
MQCRCMALGLPVQVSRACTWSPDTGADETKVFLQARSHGSLFVLHYQTTSPTPVRPAGVQASGITCRRKQSSI